MSAGSDYLGNAYYAKFDGGGPGDPKFKYDFGFGPGMLNKIRIADTNNPLDVYFLAGSTTCNGSNKCASAFKVEEITTTPTVTELFSVEFVQFII